MKRLVLQDKQKLRKFLKSINDNSKVCKLGFLFDGDWLIDPQKRRKYHMIYLINVDDMLWRIYEIKDKKHLSLDKSITVFFKELEATLADYFDEKFR